jgi:hypothetical protein
MVCLNFLLFQGESYPPSPLGAPSAPLSPRRGSACVCTCTILGRGPWIGNAEQVPVCPGSQMQTYVWHAAAGPQARRAVLLQVPARSQRARQQLRQPFCNEPV